jgi:ATP-binding cassette subfamily B protein/subfamily B ATP-binding cassette protein MsbA
MKNFLRALRYAWPYRRRLLTSVVCAALAALFWGLNLSCIYPVLMTLNTGKSLQEWFEAEYIVGAERAASQLQAEHAQLASQKKRAEELPLGKLRDKQLRDVNIALARIDRKLSWATRKLWLYQVVTKYLSYLPDDAFLTLAWVIGIVFVGVILKCFFEFCQESLVGSVVNLSLFDLRNRFYRNVIHLDVDQFGEQGTSELMARFTNDMESLGTGIKTLFGKVVAEPLKALSCVLLACLVSWQLTLMFLVLVPIAGFVLTKVGRIMKQATRRLLERMSNIYKILQESFQGIRVVKAFTMEPYERRRFFTATKDYYRKAMRVVNLDALAGPIIELLGIAAVAGALLAGAYMVLHKETKLFGLQLADEPMKAEELLQLYIWLAAIADPVRKLSSVYTKIQSGFAAADRIFAFADRRPRVHGNTEGPRLPRLQPEMVSNRPTYVEFRNVCFSYEPGRPILTNVNLTIRAGETIAIVGPNGCGKTTLLGLVPRFYDPDHGTILIDGHDLRKLNLRSLRQQIGVVTQETVLFDDTIHNNLAYGSRGARPEDVEAAARRAFAHEFIVDQPKGYQTRLGEASYKLSGGQRQRLALARAILRDPSILILDEFTSQYDAESEALIHKALREFVRGRTTFIITHRLHTLEIADRIVVLDAGRIAAVGTHAELLASCPAYQRLHEAQSQRLCA